MCRQLCKLRLSSSDSVRVHIKGIFCASFYSSSAQTKENDYSDVEYENNIKAKIVTNKVGIMSAPQCLLFISNVTTAHIGVKLDREHIYIIQDYLDLGLSLVKGYM